MLHVISTQCVAHDLHTISPWPLEHMCWRQFAVQWGDCKKKKSQIIPLNSITCHYYCYVYFRPFNHQHGMPNTQSQRSVIPEWCCIGELRCLATTVVSELNLECGMCTIPQESVLSRNYRVLVRVGSRANAEVHAFFASQRGSFRRLLKVKVQSRPEKERNKKLLSFLVV